ncbi:Geranylgeranyl diphosphate synthase type III [Fasciolopsis buskii]|uniref:Geranylgeranyl diphosphate synthase type III n=1 Tax=Fasciolopsis buskii TaxID=27845 RepID=A0A8E0RTV2_9TREM|nr:Geranylgeranyl diphosphate synthase type III [Fasciolopsis buski]
MESPQKALTNGVTDDFLLEPYGYLANNMGKELRRELIVAFNHWLDVPPQKLYIINEVIRMLHNASLIIDDIEDGSTIRRGKPAAHCVFGAPLSINSANFVYFLALQKVLELQHPEAVTIFTEQMIELHRGQGMDIFWRRSSHCPTESEYRNMAVRKTGGLFGLAVRLMQLFSDNKANFKPLVDTLGLLFQIRDDYANMIDNSQYHKSKTFADDLTEGKFSFPIVQAIRNHPKDSQVLSIVSQHTTDPSLKRYCVQHMAELGALDSTVEAMAELESQCLNLIQQHNGNIHLSKFVHCLARLYRTPDKQLRRHTPAEFNMEPNQSCKISNSHDFVPGSSFNLDSNSLQNHSVHP